MNDWVNVEKFKEEAILFLKTFGLEVLRPYGRKVGLRVATKLKKKDVILQTIAVLCSEQEIDRTNRGAPRKNEYIPPELIAGMDKLISLYLYGEVLAGNCEQTSISTPIEEKAGEQKPYYTIIVKKENGETVMSLGTCLDFQIVLSNQKPITSTELTKETSENNL